MTETITLDTRKCESTVGNARIAPLRRGERGNVPLVVFVRRNCRPYDLTGMTAYLVWETADGKLVGPVPMEVTDQAAGTVRCTLPDACYSAVGTARAYVELRRGAELVDTTDELGVKVLDCIDADAEQAEEYKPLIAEVQNAVADAKRATTEASEAASHQPRIGGAGTWETWDAAAGAYADTGVSAQGSKGDPGEPGAPGAPGKDGSDAAATDVRIAGKSITADGVADIPLASDTHIGLVKLLEYGGLVYGEGGLETVPASEAVISARGGSHYLIPADSRLDYAVKVAMCDGKGAEWTAAEQAAARKRMGFGDSLELIEVWELDHDETMEFSRDTTPAGDPYRFKEPRVAIRYANGSGTTNVSVGAHSLKKAEA